MSINYTYKTKGDFTSVGRNATIVYDGYIDTESSNMNSLDDCVFLVELTVMSRVGNVASTSGTGVYIQRVTYIRDSGGNLSVPVTAAKETAVDLVSPVSGISWLVSSNRIHMQISVLVPDLDAPNNTTVSSRWFATILGYKPSL